MCFVLSLTVFTTYGRKVHLPAWLAAEVLFLRKQLAFYQEQKIKPRRFDDCARISLLLLAKHFDWKNALVNVKPEMFVGCSCKRAYVAR
jgi:hypothetical protein